MELFAEQLEDEQLGIVDGMIDWVRVVDRNNVVLYANKKMKKDLGNIVGSKCYEVLCKSKNCEHCISNETLKNGTVQKKEEYLDGKTYMVISSPLANEKGEILGSVEVFRDITNEKILAKKVSEKNKKMSNDIKFARNMQYRMLPPKGMYNGLNIDYLYESSESLSGDFFDVFKIDNNKTGIYICDVVGHGITASLLTVFVRQSLRTLAKDNLTPNKIMKELHRSFLALNLDTDKYFSLFFGIYNKVNKKFQYVNAGHNSIPFLLRNKKVTFLEAKGYPICNIFDHVEYDVNSLELSEGDKLFFYTDGITETRNENGEEYGVDNLIELIKTEENILETLKSTLESFSVSQKDDYTVLKAEII